MQNWLACTPKIFSSFISVEQICKLKLTAWSLSNVFNFRMAHKSMSCKFCTEAKLPSLKLKLLFDELIFFCITFLSSRLNTVCLFLKGIILPTFSTLEGAACVPYKYSSKTAKLTNLMLKNQLKAYFRLPCNIYYILQSKYWQCRCEHSRTHWCKPFYWNYVQIFVISNSICPCQAFSV